MHEQTKEITDIILKAKERAIKETGNAPEPELTKSINWPVNCIVGPGLEGAIACETRIGYVNGTKGWLIYRGYNIFDLCAYATFEEVSYLLMYGYLPSESQLSAFKKKLVEYRNIHHTKRLLMSFPVEKMHPMAGLRLGTNLMRQEFTDVDRENYTSSFAKIISADEDSIPMETQPIGEERAIYEFKQAQREKIISNDLKHATGFESCFHLLSGVANLTGALSRLRQGALPIEDDSGLSFAGNLIYTMTGKKPNPIEERIMDVSLILHADHGMNASTFAAMVVASTLSDVYLSVGAGIAALQGSLHGGANERVIEMLNDIGSVENVKHWFEKKRAKKEKVMGFGHRVYKAYDPRALVLGPLAKFMTKNDNNNGKKLFKIAQALEKEAVSTLGKEKKIFPNVDFYSGIVYAAMGIPSEFYTPIFAVSRVAGWTARVQEYMRNNRIFRPRAMYTGPFDKEFTPINERGIHKKSK